MQILTDTVRPPTKGERSDPPLSGQVDFRIEFALQDSTAKASDTPLAAMGYPAPNSWKDTGLADVEPSPPAEQDPRQPNDFDRDHPWPHLQHTDLQHPTMPAAPEMAARQAATIVPLSAERPTPNTETQTPAPTPPVEALPGVDPAPFADAPDQALHDSRRLDGPNQAARAKPIDANVAETQTKTPPDSRLGLRTPAPNPVTGMDGAMASVSTDGPVPGQNPDQMMRQALAGTASQVIVTQRPVTPPPQIPKLQAAFRAASLQQERASHSAALPAPMPDEHAEHAPPSTPTTDAPTLTTVVANGPKMPQPLSHAPATAPTDSAAPLFPPADVGQAADSPTRLLGLAEAKTASPEAHFFARHVPSPAGQAAQSIVSAAQNDATRITELTLAPEELGKLRFEIATQDDRLTVRLYAERPETLDLLRRQSDVLLAELRQAGYAQSSLSFGSWDQNRSGPSDAKDQPAFTEPEGTQTLTLQAVSTAAPHLGSGRLNIRL